MNCQTNGTKSCQVWYYHLARFDKFPKVKKWQGHFVDVVFMERVRISRKYLWKL